MSANAGNKVGSKVGMVSLTVRVSGDQNERLAKIAKATFRKKTDVVRLAISRYLEAEAEKQEGGDR